MDDATAQEKPHEHWLHQIWARQTAELPNLHTVDGKPVKVEFPGWWNRGAGPDFYDARIQVGNHHMLGSVELHLLSGAWFRHGHDQDAHYNAVVLHVVLDHDCDKPIIREDGRTVAMVELRPFLKKENFGQFSEARQLLEHYDQLPGRCGSLIDDKGLVHFQQFLGKAAELRVQQKAAPLLERWNQHLPEQMLFEQVFKALGQKEYALTFEQLAQSFPLEVLYPDLANPQRQARAKVLSLWFGACGLLQNLPGLNRDPTLRKEWYTLKEQWQNHDLQLSIDLPTRKVQRPLNHPQRRLVGMFHHLYRMSTGGYLKSWLVFFRELQAYENDKQLKKLVLQRTQNLFATPDWEHWQQVTAFGKEKQTQSAQLIGEQRQIVIWANALLPFFLAYARKNHNQELEKLLYRIFMILPPEQPNQHIHFMRKRLQLEGKRKLVNSMRTGQGLIQVYRDFCHCFYEGCAQCSLVEFIQRQQID